MDGVTTTCAVLVTTSAEPAKLIITGSTFNFIPWLRPGFVTGLTFARAEGDVRFSVFALTITVKENGVDTHFDVQSRFSTERATAHVTRSTNLLTLEASKVLQLQLVDHVIIGSPAPGRSSYFSRQSNLPTFGPKFFAASEIFLRDRQVFLVAANKETSRMRGAGKTLAVLTTVFSV
jgi:hypothetical protein